MIDLEYVDQLITLAYHHEKDRHLCRETCNECKLDIRIKLIAQDIETTYCDILTSIYNAWINNK